MRNIAQIAIFSILIFLCSCNFITDKTPSLDTAEAVFISATQYMSERDAIYNEIAWYQAPQIIERTLSRELTGREVIHEMNILLKENEEAKPDPRFGWTFRWNEEWISIAKNYAVQHPDEIVAVEYHFTGIFTNYSADSKYSKIRKRMLYIFSPVDQWWDFHISSN